MAEIKGKIGVLIEDHFDPTEFRRFNEYFPQRGYVVEYISHLWGQPSLRFSSNPDNNIIEEHVTVTTEVNMIDPADYKGIICIGAYAMDRLRYQTTIKQRPAKPGTRSGISPSGYTNRGSKSRDHLSWSVAVLC